MSASFLSPFQRIKKMRRALRWGLSCALGLGFATMSGCALEFQDPIADGATVNSCESSSECGAGFCRSGRCQTNTTEIPALLVQVTPPTGAVTPEGFSLGGLSYTNVIEQFEVGPAGYEIALGHLSLVSAKLSLPELSDGKCLVSEGEDSSEVYPVAGDGTVPSRVTLVPRSRLVGLDAPVTSEEITAPVVLGDTSETSYELKMSVPPGSYDIYVEPLSDHGGCIRAPYLAIDQEFGPGYVDLQLDLAPPEVLDVTVRYPRASNDLRNWQLDLVEKTSGRVLSNRAVLHEPVETEDGLDYTVQLVFHSVEGAGDTGGDELVRLSPPEEQVAPTVFLERSVVDLFQDGTGLVDQLTDLPDAVEYSSRVVPTGATEGIPAIVTMVATELDAVAPGTVTAFSRTFETEEDGTFEVKLLPGDYRVLAEPADPQYARKLLDVVVSDNASSQTGPNVEVVWRNSLTGQVLFQDQLVSGAVVSAGSVPVEESQTILGVAEGALMASPVAFGTTSDNSGFFTITADVGTFHVSARPDPSTGFAWAVQLGVEVSGNQDLGRIDLPLPVVVPGVLTSQDTGDVVPSALIRAYALLADGQVVPSLQEADSVVAVAESRVDELGRFTLYLPSAL